MRAWREGLQGHLTWETSLWIPRRIWKTLKHTQRVCFLAVVMMIQLLTRIGFREKSHQLRAEHASLESRTLCGTSP